MDKEKVKEAYMKEAYAASSAKFFNVDRNSYHYKELEKSFERFYCKLMPLVENYEKQRKKKLKTIHLIDQ